MAAKAGRARSGEGFRNGQKRAVNIQSGTQMSPLRSPRDTRRTFPRYLRAMSIRRGRDTGGLHFEIGDDLALVGKDASTTGLASISAWDSRG
jgi:hypothetical protein